MLIWQQTLLARAIKATIVAAPGPTTFTAGNDTLGYYGDVSTALLISGNDLALRVGLTAGNAQNSASPWLKFKHNGKVLFVSRHPYRHSISWQNLSDANLVTGNKTVIIGSNEYKIRLMTGAPVNPYTAAQYGTAGSEMHDLLGNLSLAGAWKLCSDSFFVAGDGSYTWCQEYPAANSANRLMGSVMSTHPSARNGVFYFDNTATDNTAYRGWRPVLELIGPAATTYTFQAVSFSPLALNAAFTHYGTTLQNGGMRIMETQFSTLPPTTDFAFGTGDFTITSEFIIHRAINGTNEASGSSVTPFIFWGTWWHTNKLNNWDLYYNNNAKEIGVTCGNFNTRKYAGFPVTLVYGTAYHMKLTRVNGILTAYINGTKLNDVSFPHSFDMNVSSPIQFGRRLGGTTGNAIWNADITIRSFDVIKGQAL